MEVYMQETLSEAGLRLHLYASELTEGLFAARTTWDSGQSQIRCILFFRKAFRKRPAAHAFAVVQAFPHLRLAACLEPSPDDAFEHLKRFGYRGNETWITVPRSLLHQHLIWQVEERLWNANQFDRNFFAEIS
jgi:hypothetical protein